MVKYLTEARLEVSSEAFSRKDLGHFQQQNKVAKKIDDDVNHFLFYDLNFIAF